MPRAAHDIEIYRALQAAGLPTTASNVSMARNIWDYAGGNLTDAQFVGLIQQNRSRFSGATAPTGGGTPGGGAPPGGGAQPSGSDGTLYVQSGLPHAQWLREVDQEKYIYDLQFQTQKDIASINDASARYIADQSAAIQRELAAGNISSMQAITAMQIASAEAMHAKDIALRQLISDREYEINQAQLALNEKQLALQEKQYKAELAANPADWLTYQAFLGGGELPSTGASATATQQAPAGTIAGTAEGLYAGGQPLYNPALSGAGVAGAHVPGPQEVSHQTLLNMTPTEQAMFQGFLQAGVEVAPGKRVAINPQDWLQQAQRGFIPGVSEPSFTPTYNF